jgi:hypothetical protein
LPQLALQPNPIYFDFLPSHSPTGSSPFGIYWGTMPSMSLQYSREEVEEINPEFRGFDKVLTNSSDDQSAFVA